MSNDIYYSCGECGYINLEKKYFKTCNNCSIFGFSLDICISCQLRHSTRHYINKKYGID